jgi:FG-GAP repeat
MGSVSPVWFSRDTPGVHLSDSSPAAAGEGLGKAVSLSADGTTALVGAWGYGGNYTGAVYVFHETPAGWSQSAVLTNGAGAADDRFGAAVALSPDGTTALIGAWGVDSDRGAAYVFHTTSEDAWASTSTPTATLTNSAGSAEDNLGWSLVSRATAQPRSSAPLGSM